MSIYWVSLWWVFCILSAAMLSICIPIVVMLNIIVLNVFNPSVIVMSFLYSKCCYAEYLYSNFRYAGYNCAEYTECHFADCLMAPNNVSIKIQVSKTKKGSFEGREKKIFSIKKKIFLSVFNLQCNFQTIFGFDCRLPRKPLLSLSSKNALKQSKLRHFYGFLGASTQKFTYFCCKKLQNIFKALFLQQNFNFLMLFLQ